MEEGFVYERKPLDPNQEFVVVRVPDKLALGQLITEIRGERTMAQLAEQCNVSPSTLSRAVNGKVTKPLSQELIKALAAKSDDPFMLDRLVRANGMADAKTCEEQKRMAHDSRSMREERLNTERKVKNIVSTELLRRGKKIPYSAILVFGPFHDLTDQAGTFRKGRRQFVRIHNGHMLPDFGTLKPIMGPLDGLHDIPKRNLISFPGKAIASLDTGNRRYKSFFPKLHEDL